MSRRRRSKNPAGWSPLFIGLAGIGLYLLCRRWRGLGNGGYGLKPPTGVTTPKPPPPVVPHMPAPTFWQKATSVAAMPLPASAGYSASSAAFQSAVAAAAPVLAKTSVTPQYKLMEQVDFSIDEKPKSQMERLQEYGKQPWLIEKERQAQQDRSRPAMEKLAERGASESVKAQEAKALEMKELFGPPTNLELPRPLPISEAQQMDAYKEIVKKGHEKVEQMREARRQIEAQGGELAARSIAEKNWIAKHADIAINELSQKIGAEEKYLAAADSDLKVLQMEMSMETDPSERAKLAQSVKEMRDLNASETERVKRKVDLMTEHLVAAAYTEVPADMAADAEVKIRRVGAQFGKVPAAPTAQQKRYQTEPTIPAYFTPTQRARATVSIDDEFGL